MENKNNMMANFFFTSIGVLDIKGMLHKLDLKTQTWKNAREKNK